MKDKCSICGKTVRNMQAIYGATGDHWGCVENNRQELEIKLKRARREYVDSILLQYKTHQITGVEAGDLIIKLFGCE